MRGWRGVYSSARVARSGRCWEQRKAPAGPSPKGPSDRPAMTSATICPECGAALTNDARRGVCPRCAVRMALMPGSDDYSESGAGGQSIRLLMADGTAAAPSLQGFGDYELIEEIGHGGMGVIFKARQRSLDRIVALKLIRAGSLARKGDITRFQTEAAAAARLKHPHIVTVYEVGEEEGRHFYSMEF